VERSICREFRDFLLPCDMVKFAKARPDAASSLGVLALGRRLVEETIPASDPDPAQAEEAVASSSPEEEEDAA
jgi:hypothetical protein